MEELDSSELGTQEYWECRYKEEVKNFNNHSDPGEIWFGEDSVDRIVRWINKNKEIEKDSKILDVGCGNGMLLIELANEGYNNLHGVDYSGTAVELAKTIAQTKKIDIKFSVCDILKGLEEQYDVIHDKGTYDAISLSKNAKEDRIKYIEGMFKGLKDNGVFIITSCNWTQSELDQQFQTKFSILNIIPTPEFKFGGKVGNVVTSCVFSKRKDS